MMSETRKKYTKEFKEQAVALLETSGKSAKQVAEELGVGTDQLYRWRIEQRNHGGKAFPGNGIPRDQELAQLRKENAELREERDILRKATAIFSRYRK